MEALLPDVPARVFARQSTTVRPATTPRRRVGMLSGCVQQVFFPHVNAATTRVLAAEGCEVIIPSGQPCCGALMLHSGLEDEAAAMAKKMIAAFENANVDTIVINSAGCGSTMKEYGHLLRDDPEWAERAAAFSAKCKDISEVLCELEPQARRHPLKLRVAYHDACHLQHAQGVREQPRRLLAGIPELEIAEIPEASLCCGSAGVFNLLQPDTAEQLGKPQGRQSADYRRRRSGFSQSGLPASTDVWPSPPRLEDDAGISYGGITRCLDARRLERRIVVREPLKSPR